MKTIGYQIYSYQFFSTLVELKLFIIRQFAYLYVFLLQSINLFKKIFKHQKIVMINCKRLLESQYQLKINLTQKTKQKIIRTQNIINQEYQNQSKIKLQKIKTKIANNQNKKQMQKYMQKQMQKHYQNKKDKKNLIEQNEHQPNEQQTQTQQHNSSSPIYQISNSLLLLENQQIVQHMLMIQDWIILSIYTPSRKQIEKNFYKQKPKHSNYIDSHNCVEQEYEEQFLNQNRNIDQQKFVSVIAIRKQTHLNQQNSKEKLNHVQKNNHAAKQGKQFYQNCNNKNMKRNDKDDKIHKNKNIKQKVKQSGTSVQEIKMLHKECRLQKMMKWTIEGDSSKTFSQSFIDQDSFKLSNAQNSFNNNCSNSLLQPNHFLLLIHTRIQLYTLQPQSITQHNISSSFPLRTSIRLTRIYQTNYLIPYNIIWLKNQLKQKELKNNKNQMKKQFQEQKQQQKQNQYSVAITGVDRRRTFWSDYYEIETIQRNIYFFKQFVITDQIKSKSNLKPKLKQQNHIKQQKMRRVRSADNILKIDQKQIYLTRKESKNSNQRNKQILAQSQYIIGENSSTDCINQNKSILQRSEKNLGSNNRSDSNSFNSPNSKRRHQINQQLNQNNFKQQNKESKQSKQDKQGKQSIQGKQRSQRKHIKQIKQSQQAKSTKSTKQSKTPQSTHKLIPKQLLYDEKMQLFPALFDFGQNQNQKQGNNTNGLGNINKTSSNKYNPALQYVHHFHLQTMQYKNTNIKKTSQNKKSRSYKSFISYQMFLLISYMNNIVLINIDKRHVLSKIVLQSHLSILDSIRIENLFGLFNIILLTKSIQQKQIQQNKPITQTQNYKSKEQQYKQQYKYKSNTKAFQQHISQILENNKQKLVQQNLKNSKNKQISNNNHIKYPSNTNHQINRNKNEENNNKIKKQKIKQKQIKTKLIKISIDMINNKKLGIGLENLIISQQLLNGNCSIDSNNSNINHINNVINNSHTNKSTCHSINHHNQIIKSIYTIWNSSLVDFINNLMDYDYYLQSKFNQSCQDVRDLIIQYQKKESVASNALISYKQQHFQQQEKLNQKIRLNQEVKTEYQQSVHFYSNLNQFINIPLKQLQYIILLLTSKGRLILYNHLTAKTIDISLPSHSKTTNLSLSGSSYSNQSKNKYFLHQVKSLSSLNKLIIKQADRSFKISLKFACISGKKVWQESHDKQKQYYSQENASLSTVIKELLEIQIY